MNERDVERRLRSVVSGEQPKAPASLHRFLRELPEKEPRRRRIRIAAGQRLLGALPRFVSDLAPQPGFARRLQLAGGLALAVVLAIAMTGILLSLRGHAPVANTPSQQPTQVVTPRRTSPQGKVISFDIPNNPYWYGMTRIGNEDEALPVVAAAISSMMFVGVSAEPYGLNGIVRSFDGLMWEWDPLSTVDPGLAELTSIASNNKGWLVAGGWAPHGNGKDGRIYVSPDGVIWKPVSTQSAFAGTPIRTIVSSQEGFIALGWADPESGAGTSAGGVQPAVLEWVSADGLEWTRVAEVPVRGPSFIFATTDGYILSGTPRDGPAGDQPPIWHSGDGRQWTQATAKDTAGQKLGPLTSLTQGMNDQLVGLAWLESGGEQLVESTDKGMQWQPISPEGLPDPGSLTGVASLWAGADKQWLIGTYKSSDMGAGKLYISRNGGRNWESVFSSAGSPLGSKLVELGAGYSSEGGYRMVLVFGKPADLTGVFLASNKMLDWPNGCVTSSASCP